MCENWTGIYMNGILTPLGWFIGYLEKRCMKGVSQTIRCEMDGLGGISTNACITGSVCRCVQMHVSPSHWHSVALNTSPGTHSELSGSVRN